MRRDYGILGRGIHDWPQVSLVQPGPDESYSNVMCSPPLGLIELYSSMFNPIKERAVLRDGNVMEKEDILRGVQEDDDIVAISANSFNYRTGLEIAEAAKEAGKIVIFGGPHTTCFQEIIGEKIKKGERPIDYVIPGRADFQFYKLIIDILDHKSSPQNGIVPDYNIYSCSSVMDYSILFKNRLTLPERYTKTFVRMGVLNKVKRSIPVFSQYACSNVGKQACKFCSVPRGINIVRPDNFESTLEKLEREITPDHVWLVDGDFSACIPHMRMIGDIFKKAISPEHGIYCFVRADNLSSKSIDRLKDAGVTSVFIGYEHGDNKVLGSVGKNFTSDQAIEATQRLADADIEVSVGSFVLGTPAETLESLDNTIDFVERLSKIGNVQSIQANTIIPSPGSHYWNELCGIPELESDLLGTDIIDLPKAVEQFQEYAHRFYGAAPRIKRATIEEIDRAKKIMYKTLRKGMEWLDRG